MATHAAKTNGTRTMHKRTSRLRKRVPQEGVTLKHRAAVFPAKNKLTKVIAVKAVVEWPEGNDLRPSSISSGSLCCVSGGSMEADLRTYPVHTCREASHWHRDKKSGRSRPEDENRCVQVRGLSAI